MTKVMKSIDLPGIPRLTWISTEMRIYWISRKLCGLLRGFDHDRKHLNVQPPEMDHDFWVRVLEAFTFLKRRYLKKLTLPDVIRTRSSDRFTVRVTATEVGSSSWRTSPTALRRSSVSKAARAHSWIRRGIH